MLLILSTFLLIPLGIILALLPRRFNRFKYIFGLVYLVYVAIVSLITFTRGGYISYEVGTGIFENIFSLKPVSVIIMLVSSVIGALILLGSMGCYKGEKEIAGATLITYGFMAGLLFSQSGLYFVLFLLLINLGMWRLSDRDSIELEVSSADHALMVRIAGWFLMIAGLFSIYFTGENFSAIPFKLGGAGFASFLVMFGLLAQGGMFPFQFWLGDKTNYHAGGGALVNTVFSSFPVLYALITLMNSQTIPDGSVIWITVLLTFTVLLCSGISLIISNTERVLGNSTASINAIAFILVIVGGHWGIELALWLLTIHASSKILLFFVMMAGDEMGNKRDMRQSSGILENFPLLTIAAIMAVIFFIPLIPFSGFTVLLPAVEVLSHKFWLIGLITSIALFLTIAYLIRIVRGYIWGSKHEEQAEGKYPQTLRFAIYSDIVFLIVITVLIFLTPRIINWTI